MTADDELDTLAKDHDARLSVWMGGLDGTPWLRRDDQAVHHAASTMKLPLVIALHREAAAGRLALDDEVPVVDTLASSVAGRTYVTTHDYDSDDEPWLRLGGTASLGWLAERAIVRSSNLATNLLIDRVGLDPVNAVYAEVGATASRLRRPIQDAPGAERGWENSATAGDLAAVLIALANHRLTTPRAAEQVETTLAADEYNDALPAGLPPGTYCAHKTGWLDQVCHDVGIVRPESGEPFVLCILTGAPLDEEAVHRLVAEAAAVCWSHREGVAP